ncbi:MAG TPA: RNA polymerase sigma-70 factor, partial [Gemmatimonadales bacterium]|nr:RNA polymerase sigma-70 factor [Gemmatimonadales bacterium]
MTSECCGDATSQWSELPTRFGASRLSASGQESGTLPERSPPWETAFARHYVELCEYVVRFVGSAEAAQDLVQDLFLRLWASRGPRDTTRLTRPYLYTAARNRALKYLRHRRVVTTWVARVASEDAPVSDSPEDLCLEGELHAAVERAIGALPPRCRTIFVLRRREQLSYREIAAQLGVSLGTVKSQMWRATLRLRTRLAPYLAPLVRDRWNRVRYGCGAGEHPRRARGTNSYYQAG